MPKPADKPTTIQQEAERWPDRALEAGNTTLRVTLVVAIFAVLAGVIWFTGARMREINRKLDASEARAQKVNDRLREYSQELERALQRAQAARRRAEEAQQTAEVETTARLHAEQQVQNVTERMEEAAKRAEIADARTRQARQELDRVRKRREAELDRMQEALNRIAPTKRTPSGMVMTLGSDHFRFDFDKAVLRPENKEMLSRIAGILLASEGYHLFIDGHTDDIGTDQYNQALSERRAKAVRDYLVDAEIPPEVITVKGFGKSQPLVKGKTKAARARNRRVDIGIVDTIVHYGKQVRRPVEQ